MKIKNHTMPYTINYTIYNDKFQSFMLKKIYTFSCRCVFHCATNCNRKANAISKNGIEKSGIRDSIPAVVDV